MVTDSLRPELQALATDLGDYEGPGWAATIFKNIGTTIGGVLALFSAIMVFIFCKEGYKRFRTRYLSSDQSRMLNQPNNTNFANIEMGSPVMHGHI